MIYWIDLGQPWLSSGIHNPGHEIMIHIKYIYIYIYI